MTNYVGEMPVSYAYSAWESVVSTAKTVRDKTVSAAYAVFNFVLPVNPVTHQRQLHLIPERVEKFVGKVMYPSMIAQSGGQIFEDNHKYGHYVKMVKEVGAALSQHSPREGLEYEFTVVASRTDNAWCLPGGKIAINLGLIKKMEREAEQFGVGGFSLNEKIAAVLSHEMTHATARHAGRRVEFSLFLTGLFKAASYAIGYFIKKSYSPTIEQAKRDGKSITDLKRKRDSLISACTFLLDAVTKVAQPGLTLHGSRKHELEADKYGMYLLADTARTYNSFNANSPQAAIWLMHFFAKHHDHSTHIGWVDWIKGFFSSHPEPKERVAANLRTWQEIEHRNISTAQQAV